MKTHRFLIIIEKTKRNYSAYAPDLPGCIATGKTLEGVRSNMRKALNLHLQGLLQDKQPIPQAHTITGYMLVA